MTNELFDTFVKSNWGFKGTGKLEAQVPMDVYLALAINGEAGEVAEEIKKAYRDKNGMVDANKVILELGDVVHYVSKMAQEFGSSLNDVMDRNVLKIEHRQKYGKEPK